MKKLFFLTLVLLVGALFLINGCKKEDSYPNENDKPTTPDVSGTIFNNENDMAITSRFECPELTTTGCDGYVMDDLVGGCHTSGLGYGFGCQGELDAVINCPTYAIEPCEISCYGSRTFAEYSTGDLPWVEFWSTSEDYPCNDGTFTAAEKQAIIDQAVSLAKTYAPLCYGTPMTPVSYDFFWDMVGSTIVVGCYVRYYSGCLG